MENSIFEKRVALVPSVLWLASLSFFAGIGSAFAQQEEPSGNTPLPSCYTVAYDPDGDGYGWSFGSSCIVDENTLPKPTFAMTNDNLQPLNMIRTYWDPSVDFANREIECRNYSTLELEDYQTIEVFKIMHYPLPDTSPWRSEYTITYTPWNDENTDMNMWGAADGIYFGDAHYYTPDDAVTFYARYWGEPIEIDGQQGMRFYWNTTPINGETEVINGDNYQECKYTSGLPFRPTGRWDQAPTPSNRTLPDIPQLEPGPSIDTMPEITNQGTGETVELRSFSWNITNDLLFKTVLCEDANWDGYSYDPFYYAYDAWTFMPKLPGMEKGSVYFNLYNRDSRRRGEWWIEDGKLKTDVAFPAAAGWYEVINRGDDPDGMTIWYSNTSIDNCYYAQQGFDLRPSGAVTEVQSNTGDSEDSYPVETSNNGAANPDNTVIDINNTTEQEANNNSTGGSGSGNPTDNGIDGNEDNNPVSLDNPGGFGEQQETAENPVASASGGGSISVLLLLILSGLRIRQTSL